MCWASCDGGGCGLCPGDAENVELGAKSTAGSWGRGGVGGKSSLAESAVGFYLAGQSAWSGLDGEDEGKLQLSMKGGLEAGRPAKRLVQGPGVAGGLQGSLSLCLLQKAGKGRGLETITSAYSCLPRTAGDGSETMERVPTLGLGGQSLLPEHCPGPPKGQGSQVCQPVPNALGRLQRI